MGHITLCKEILLDTAGTTLSLLAAITTSPETTRCITRIGAGLWMQTTQIQHTGNLLRITLYTTLETTPIMEHLILVSRFSHTTAFGEGIEFTILLEKAPVCMLIVAFTRMIKPTFTTIPFTTEGRIMMRIMDMRLLLVNINQNVMRICGK